MGAPIGAKLVVERDMAAEGAKHQRQQLPKPAD
jgi:hypothetical protein